MSALRRLLPELLVCALVLAAAALSPRLWPYNMDEFSAYHVLGCLRSTLSLQYNDFDLGCQAFDLRLPGTSLWLPLRAYTYLGAAQTVFFLPFWALIRDPVAGRILGAVCLLFAAWCIARLARVRWRHALLASLLLPVYAMAYPEETGSAALPVCTVLAVMLLVRRAVAAEGLSRQLVAGIAVGLTAFLGIFMKPVFLWTGPALLLWAIASWREQLQGEPARLARIPWAAAFGALIAAAVPLLLLLLSTDRDGHRYMEVTSSGGLTLSPRSIAGSVRWLGMLVTNSAMFNNRVLSLPGNLLLDAVPALLAAAVLAWALWRTPRPARSLLQLFLAQAVVTFGVICTNSSAWAPHHLVFALVFLVMALAVSLQQLGERLPRAPRIAALLCALYWATLVARLPQAYIHRDTNFDKDRLVSFVRSSGLDASTVQLHSDWGTYYIAHTFGDPRQLTITQLLYWHPRAEQRRDLERVRDIALRLQRDVLLIGMEGNGASRDPLVLDTLGTPVEVYRFDTWTATRFRPRS